MKHQKLWVIKCTKETYPKFAWYYSKDRLWRMSLKNAQLFNLQEAEQLKSQTQKFYGWSSNYKNYSFTIELYAKERLLGK